MTTLLLNKSVRSALLLTTATLSLGLATPGTAKAQSSLNPCPGIYYEAPLNKIFLSPEGCPANAARQAMQAKAEPSAAAPIASSMASPMASPIGNSTRILPRPAMPMAITPGSGTAIDRGMPAADGTMAIDRGRALNMGGDMADPTLMTPPTSMGVTSVAQPPLPEVRDQLLTRVMPTDEQVMVRLMNQTNTAVTYEVIGQTDRRTLMGGESVMLIGLPLPSTISAIRQDNGMLDFKAMSSEPGMLEVMLNVDTMMDDNQGVLRIQEDGEVYIN